MILPEIIHEPGNVSPLYKQLYIFWFSLTEWFSRGKIIFSDRMIFPNRMIFPDRIILPDKLFLPNQMILPDRIYVRGYMSCMYAAQVALILPDNMILPNRIYRLRDMSPTLGPWQNDSPQKNDYPRLIDSYQQNDSPWQDDSPDTINSPGQNIHTQKHESYTGCPLLLWTLFFLPFLGFQRT